MSTMHRVVTVIAVLMAIASIPTTSAQCPISSSDAARFDYTPIKANCSASPKLPRGICDTPIDLVPTGRSIPLADRCEACGCAVVEVFAQNPAVLNSADAGGLASCTSVLLPSLLRAGVDVAALADLQSCPRQVPSCVPPEFVDLAGRVLGATG